MRKIVSYLEERRELNVSLLITYFILLIVLHDPMVNLSVWAMRAMTFTKYNLLIGLIMLSAFTAFIFLFYKNLQAYPHHKDAKITYFLIVTGLLVLHVHVNFVMNIEIIHTVQFGILALLIFPLTRSFGSTLFYTVLLGMADEGYQYTVLYADRGDYFDFNDVILDQLGAGLALVYLYSAGLGVPSKPKYKWYKSPVLITMCVLVVAIAAMFHFSVLSVYAPQSGDALLALNQAEGPESFWRYLPNSKIIYHVMTPIEGVTVITLLCSFFFLLDFLVRKNAVKSNAENKSGSMLRIVRDGNESQAMASSPAMKVSR